MHPTRHTRCNTKCPQEGDHVLVCVILCDDLLSFVNILTSVYGQIYYINVHISFN